MNKAKRSSLEKTRHLPENAVDIVSDIRYEEQDALDNMLDNLQSTIDVCRWKGQLMPWKMQSPAYELST